jgi:hypothetical protein
MTLKNSIDVGLRIPTGGDGVILRIRPECGTWSVFSLSVEEALELGRGLLLMADLHQSIRKEKP